MWIDQTVLFGNRLIGRRFQVDDVEMSGSVQSPDKSLCVSDSMNPVYLWVTTYLKVKADTPDPGNHFNRKKYLVKKDYLFAFNEI